MTAQSYRNGTPASQLRGIQWHKSTLSNPDGSCVEIAVLDERTIAVRNSRDPHGPALIYTPAEITAFLDGAKRGEFDFLLPQD
jgi:Domain of unknown function (DUF397)